MIDNSRNKHYAIIVAGGSGSRMNSAVPKQFLLLNGKPVLMHTAEAFFNSAYKPSVIIVISSEYHIYWNDLCAQHHFTVPHTLTNGGVNRFQSVKNALMLIPDSQDALVAIQDGVRPLSSKEIIDASYRSASIYGNAVTAVKSRDSVRYVTGDVSTGLKRENIYLMQTPQTFQANQIKQAYSRAFDPDFTDDASVAEQAGFRINITEGNYINIKITYPEDLDIAELIIKKGCSLI